MPRNIKPAKCRFPTEIKPVPVKADETRENIVVFGICIYVKCSRSKLRG
jgi:hypothetical protein